MWTLRRDGSGGRLTSGIKVYRLEVDQTFLCEGYYRVDNVLPGTSMRCLLCCQELTFRPKRGLSKGKVDGHVSRCLIGTCVGG